VFDPFSPHGEAEVRVDDAAGEAALQVLDGDVVSVIHLPRSGEVDGVAGALGAVQPRRDRFGACVRLSVVEDRGVVGKARMASSGSRSLCAVTYS
jgi:hypothetical protein